MLASHPARPALGRSPVRELKLATSEGGLESATGPRAAKAAVLRARSNEDEDLSMSRNSGNTTKDPNQMSEHQTGQVGDMEAGKTATMPAQTGGSATQTGETQAGSGAQKQKNQTQSHEQGQGRRSGQSDGSKVEQTGGGPEERGPRGTNV